MSSFFPLYFTEAQPHPDFFSGLMIFLQFMAYKMNNIQWFKQLFGLPRSHTQALGEQKIVSVSCDLIFPSSSRSPTNFWLYVEQKHFRDLRNVWMFSSPCIRSTLLLCLELGFLTSAALVAWLFCRKHLDSLPLCMIPVEIRQIGSF